MRIITLLSLCLASAGALAQSNETQLKSPKLSVGSLAPSIKVGSWAQGKPLLSLQKGKVYVFEFWATWCGPCFKAMPHLSELSKRYKGTVSFVGVNVWEDKNGSYTAPDKVANFFKDNPGRMTYNVAVDTKEAYMATNWLSAAGVNSIPTTIVVGKDLKVAFIGHPMDLDLVLDPIIEGRFDAKAFASRPKAPNMDAASKALNDRDVKTLNSEANRIEKGWPVYKDIAYSYRFVASYIEDPEKIQAEVTKKIDAGEVQSMSFALVTLTSCNWINTSDLKKIVDWFELTVKKDPAEGFMSLISLPDVYRRLGENAKADEATARLVEWGKKMGLDEATIKRLSSRSQGSGGGR